MANNNVFKQYRARIAREGILKALLWGLCCGLFVLAATALLSWFIGFEAGLYIAIALFAVTAATITPILYFKRYRPTAKAVAQRVDSLGLEERALTMVELENDPSYIAARQREDTVAALSSVSSMLVAVTVSAALIAVFSVSLLLGASGITVGALYAADVIPSGMSLVTEEPLPATFIVSYSAEGKGGYVMLYTGDWTEEETPEETPEEGAQSFAKEGEGDADELSGIVVTEGEDAPAVLAVANEGYIFVGWSDGVTEAYRCDLAVKKDIDVNAVFLKVTEEAEDPESQSFSAPYIYKEPSDDENEGQDGPPFPPQGSNQSQSQPGDGDDSGPGGLMENDSSNKILDNQTFYGDTYEYDRESAMGRLGSDESMSDDLKQSVSDYFDSIQQNSSQDGGEGGEGEGEGGN